MKMNQKLNEIYNSKLFWMIFSLLASVLLWAYITSIDSNEQSWTYRGIPVVFSGEDVLEDRGLIISDVDVSSVTVTITGNRRELGKFTATDLAAVVNVSNISQPNENSRAYEIQFPNGVNHKNFTITYYPENINFTVEKETSKVVEVRGMFNGSSAEGYVVESGAMKFEPSTLTIYGTAEELAKISYARVTIDGDNIDRTIHENRPYTYMNANDEEVTVKNVSSDVDTVATTLPVNMLKELELSVDILPGGGANVNNCKVKISPEKITLSGDSEELSTMNKLTIGTIDLSDYDEDTELTFPLELGDGVQCVTGETEVKVTLKFSGLSKETFEVSDLRYINCAKGTKASIVNKTLNVAIRAPKETLDKISADDIRVVADLTDYKSMTGYVTVPVKIYIDGVTGAGAVGDYTVTINLTS